jgi:hemolysin III
MTTSDSAYPAYARSERIADGVIHAMGILFALSGGTVLIVMTALGADAALTAGVSVYAAALLASFAASAFYHMTPWERARPVLRRLDHAAIYLKIAGTYTPLVVMIGGAFAYSVLTVVWVLAAAGAVTKVAFWRTPGRFGPLLYLALGWLAMLLVWPMVQTLPVWGSVLAIAGGLIYSAGVIFFSWETLKFSNAIWHGFVLVASACFFAAILLGIVTA